MQPRMQAAAADGPGPSGDAHAGGTHLWVADVVYEHILLELAALHFGSVRLVRMQTDVLGDGQSAEHGPLLGLVRTGDAGAEACRHRLRRRHRQQTDCQQQTPHGRAGRSAAAAEGHGDWRVKALRRHGALEGTEETCVARLPD